jgi:hypothetical protein
LGIDFRDPGFFGSPAFRKAEQRVSSLFERYAEYVDRRSYSEEYLDRVRRFVPTLAEFVYRELIKDGSLGISYEVCRMVAQMLNAESIWYYAVGGPVSVHFPASYDLEPKHFPALATKGDRHEHMWWLRVPPFAVLDITLATNDWPLKHRGYLPPYVLSEQSRPMAVPMRMLFPVKSVEKFLAEDGSWLTIEDVQNEYSEAYPVMERFPPFSVESAMVEILYAPAIILSDHAYLDELAVPRLNGRYPVELYFRFKRQHPSGDEDEDDFFRLPYEP